MGIRDNDDNDNNNNLNRSPSRQRGVIIIKLIIRRPTDRAGSALVDYLVRVCVRALQQTHADRPPPE